MLDTARSGATKTRIMYLSFLSFKQLQKYLNYVLENNLIDIDHTVGKYITTVKGLEFLKCVGEVQSIEYKAMEKRRLLSEMLKNMDV